MKKQTKRIIALVTTVLFIALVLYHYRPKGTTRGNVGAIAWKSNSRESSHQLLIEHDGTYDEYWIGGPRYKGTYIIEGIEVTLDSTVDLIFKRGVTDLTYKTYDMNNQLIATETIGEIYIGEYGMSMPIVILNEKYTEVMNGYNVITYGSLSMSDALFYAAKVSEENSVLRSKNITELLYP